MSEVRPPPKHQRRRVRAFRLALVLAVAVTLAVVFDYHTSGARPAAHAPVPSTTVAPQATSVATARAPRAPAPAFADKVPVGSSQAVVVTAASASATTNTVALWARSGSVWRREGSTMEGRNGDEGWTTHRVEDDLQSPIGVFSLTYAGGALPNPGTREPYEHDPTYFDDPGTFLGHSLAGVFDYVEAIDFNRVPGTPPSSQLEPKGVGPGSGIWLHVGNGLPSEGCVTVSRSDMVRILRWLDPDDRPVIVMGPTTATS